MSLVSLNSTFVIKNNELFFKYILEEKKCNLILQQRYKGFKTIKQQIKWLLLKKVATGKKVVPAKKVAPEKNNQSCYAVR